MVLVLGGYAVAYILPLSTNDCYLLFIFFRNILKIITNLLVYINISCIFTP